MVSDLPITNISCYKFAPLSDLKSLRESLQLMCKERGLKGTILLSTEGINFFIAGARSDVDALVDVLRAIPGLEDLAPKYSFNEHQPFNRMLVRIKKEIIAFGVEGIDPSRYTSPHLKAAELKRWLDEGRPIVLLDTRNDYEVKLGTFKGATVIGVDTFRNFPEAVRRLPPELKKQPIVSFCTGGIRCEKAAPFLESEGFEQVWQLDGGILKYFEEVGGDHWEGECFVFDQRVGVDPALRETEATKCFICQSPLSDEDQQDPRYVEGKSCHYCFKTTDEQRRENIVNRQAAIRRVSTPLPGSVPYDNHRPLSIPAPCDGMTLLETVTTIFPYLPRADWLTLFETGRLLNEEKQPAGPDTLVRAGERYYRLHPGITEPDVNADIRLVHEDEAIIVVEKPAPLPMHASGRFNRNTLQHILHAAYQPQKPRACHRLDANTTGLVVLARTRQFAQLVQDQFARTEVEKVYLARVIGHPTEDEFSCDLPISTDAGALGSREIDEEDGDDARTEFRVLRREADGTSLIEARPLTGRTNQIRVHLWQLGHPIVGDPVYLPGGAKGDTQTLDAAATPMCLHAHRVSFVHPLSGERVTFESPAPWSADVLVRSTSNPG